MDTENLITVMVTIAGVVLSLGYYPQAWHIWRLRSAKDISIFSYVIFAIGTSTLLWYGFYKNDIVIISSFLFGALGSMLVLCLALYFRFNSISKK